MKKHSKIFAVILGMVLVFTSGCAADKQPQQENGIQPLVETDAADIDEETATGAAEKEQQTDRKSTRLNSSHP